MATRILSVAHDLHQTLDFIDFCVRGKLDLAALELSLEGFRKDAAVNEILGSGPG